MEYDVTMECYNGYINRYAQKAATRYGLSLEGWMSNKYVYKGTVSARAYHKLSAYCQKKKLNLKLMNDFAVRSTDYRRKFFAKNKPHLFGRYFCAYCGKLVKREDLTVDHLYPVNCAQKSLYMQKKLRRMGLKSINDERNLIAACRKCNERKSAKMGIWILKGKLGRYPMLWRLRHVCSLTLLGILLLLVYQNCAEEIIMLIANGRF